MAANPRAAAVAALVRQEQDGFSNLILDAELKHQKLEGRDKAFASAIFYTVLEHRGTLDYILEQFLPKGLAKLDAPVREILRAALAQARYMQVPVSAAVNEAVKLTRSFKKSSASGLVNAVLRRACTYDLDTAVFRDDIERLMVLGSAGRDVAEFLHKNYPDEAWNILTYKADGGLTSLRANPLKADAAALCEKLTALGVREVRQGVVPGSVLARFEGSPADQELFRQGYYHVEGQASQLAALCVEAKPGETVLDLCAAPGGKTLLLAEEMQNTGTLYSCDATENRVQLIRTAVERMGFTNVKTLCNDATQTNPALPQADRILADVPCSGLGIIGHPGGHSGYSGPAAQGWRAAGLLYLHHRAGRKPAADPRIPAAAPGVLRGRACRGLPGRHDGNRIWGALGAHPHRHGRLFPLCAAKNALRGTMPPCTGSY